MFRSVKKEEITIPAQMSYLVQIRDFVEHIGKKYKYSEKLINSFKLVIDEAATNITRHGYRDIKNGEIEIKAIIRRLSLTIVITDQGTSYDPREANTPDLAKYVDIGKKGGLGIMMMRKLMDDIQYVVTERGNEFRLTKYREKTDESKYLQLWHGLNMKTRYSLISSFIFTLVMAAIFTMLFINLEEDVYDEVINSAATSTRSLAENSVGDLITNDYPLRLYENTTSVIKSTEIDIYEAFIVNPTKSVIARSTLIGSSALKSSYSLPEEYSVTDSLENVVIYEYEMEDTLNIYDVVSLIRGPSDDGQGQVLGEAHVWVTSSTINDITSGRQLTLIIVLILVLGAGNAGAFYLVAKILKSFHSLAEWVREVVRGKVDQDEIDIDTSDEIGEIAQAFNEMTDKFRKAQVNLMEQQKLQKELQVAQEIQQMLLPSDFPQVDGYDLGSYYEAAKEVGGDLFDFVEVDEESVGIIVADVSGKGVPGSLIMTMIRTALRLESRGNKNPADVLAKVNKFVSDDMRKGMFVTMFYCILDSRNRVISYASAGHNPMILFRSSAKQTYYLNPSGFPVGIQLPDPDLFEKKIVSESIRLREDDILVLYTDGVTEAMNHQRELFRDERFLQSIRDNGHLDVTEFVKSIKDDLKNFTGGAPQNDDITFVSIKEKLMAEDIIYNTHKKIIDLIKDGMKVKDACDKLNISSYQYYKYKGIVDEGGLESLKEYLEGDDHIEIKHISIELKAKIFNVINENPKYGAKKIAELLNTKKYGFEKIDERRIYNELVKLRLNTQERRKRFKEKGHHNRLKQPGTPLLTLDGKVILDFESSEGEIEKRTGSKSDTAGFTPPKPVQEQKEAIVRELSSADQDKKPGVQAPKRKIKELGDTFLEKEKVENKPEVPKKTVKSEAVAKPKKKTTAASKKIKEKAVQKELPAKEVKSISKPKVKAQKAIDEVKTSEILKVEKEVIDIPDKLEPKEFIETETIEIEEISVPTTEELKRKAVEKLDRSSIDKLFYECKDDFDSLNELFQKLSKNPESGDEVRKMNLILKIVLSNPILKALTEVNQLIIQSQLLIADIQKDYLTLKKETVLKTIATVLSHLEKESILNKSESIIEKINRIGILHKNLEKTTDENKSPRNELDKIRSKIANKQLIKNKSLLEALEESPKK